MRIKPVGPTVFAVFGWITKKNSYEHFFFVRRNVYFLVKIRVRKKILKLVNK